MFDIFKLAIQQTATIEIKHPDTGEPITFGKKTASVTLMSEANPARKKALLEFADIYGADSSSDEQKEAAGINYIKSCIVQFDNINATPEMLDDPQFVWLRKQIESEMGRVGNFLPK